MPLSQVFLYICRARKAGFLGKYQNMPSGIYIEIKLHPFYQEFLRHHYQMYEPVFAFPQRDRFNFFLEHYLITTPKQSASVYSDKNDIFLVELPDSDLRDPFYYNYISKRSHDLFVKRLTSFINHLIFDRIYDLRRKGFDKQEAIVMLMEEFSLNPKFEDMVIKKYNRAIDAERMRKYRRKQKKIKYIAPL
jgi:hypothetical protein